jgi:hypothetical protein
MFADAREDIVVDPSNLSFCLAPSIDASRASIQRPSVDWGRPLQPSSVGARLGKNHLHNGTEARKSSGRDPPRHLPLQPTSRRPCRLSFVRGNSAFATDGSVRSICARVLGQRPRKADTSFSPEVLATGFAQRCEYWRTTGHASAD